MNSLLRMRRPGWFVAVAIVSSWLVPALFLAGPRLAWRAATQEPRGADTVLINTCLITKDVRGLAAFDTRVLQIEPRWEGDSYVEFHTGAGVLALFAADAQEKYMPGSVMAARNRSAILEFKVSNLDREYARLRDSVEWVKGPTTQAWGTRSIYFRDPDGNLLDFFVPAQHR